MDAPKCRLCGTRHYGLLCQRNHILNELTAESQRLGLYGDPAKGTEVPAAGDTTDKAFDRTAYQREYMRKWRKTRRRP